MDKIYRDLKALILVLNYNGINVKPDALIHEYALDKNEAITPKDIQFICKNLKLKYLYKKITKEDLNNIVTPCIYITKDNNYNIIINKKNDTIITLNLDKGKPEAFSIESFSKVWTGEIILMKGYVR